MSFSQLLRLSAVCCLMVLTLLSSMYAQPPINPLDDESDFYAETKQVNQFFRRFNAEETLKGDRLYLGDIGYRDLDTRKKYIELLFDKKNTLMTRDVKFDFISDVCEGDTAFWLEFHGGQWFAEVSTLFSYNGRSIPVTLYMEIEQAAVGSKWVIQRAYSSFFDSLYSKTIPVGTDSFLHPLSHEIEFMNLGKAFKSQGSLSPFLAKTRNPDHLTLLLQGWENRKVRFELVEEVVFHFFQVPGWYFEVSHFNRSSYNKGWLISKLTQIEEDKKPVLEAFILKGQP